MSAVPFLAPDGDDDLLRLPAQDIRVGDTVRVAGAWRVAGAVLRRTGASHVWIHVDWQRPAGSRTVFHSHTAVSLRPGMGPVVEEARRVPVFTYSTEGEVWA
ncbi:hypothetical protein ACIQRS_06350 [Streptomyces termitum]|uniref:hypothetical protein n=1 Tax=Streptomyces termitum TaxID=67368 RepID=UPI00167AD1DA|nr:hypothetical protein [Streptomyces termitum]